MDILESIVQMIEEELFNTLKEMKKVPSRGSKEDYSRIVLNLTQALECIED